MESEDQVYVTLPSNSSLDYFPHNSLSSFTTKLATPLHLRGDWEVALVDVIYPHSWLNVNSQNNKYSFILRDQVMSAGRLPAGQYTDPQTICDALNESLPGSLKNNALFMVNHTTCKVEARIKPETKINLSEGLAQLLGFSQKTLIDDTEASFLPDINGGLFALYVYTDIIENQRVGDVSAPLLRIVPTNPKKAGLVITHSYQLPHYLPVKTNYIDTVQVDIRSDFGEKIPFESGKVVVKLHFRSTRKQNFIY